MMSVAMRFFLPLLLTLALISFGTQTPAQEQKIIRVTGKLLRVMGPGGETTGWSITFNSKIDVEGQRLSSIEVEGPASKLDKLENKRVNIQGQISHRHSVMRRDWPVLVISSIQEFSAQ